MKQMVTFRFTPHAIVLLAALNEHLNMTKTEVIEEAINLYAKKKLHIDNPLLKFAGTLDSEDADEMLKNIKNNRKNKEIQGL